MQQYEPASIQTLRHQYIIYASTTHPLLKLMRSVLLVIKAD